jgi:phosphate acetyltransferase
MSFRTRLRARAAGINARLIFPEGDDPRVRQAAELLAQLKIADPLLIQGTQVTEIHSAQQKRVAALLRERRPHAVRDGLHALDLARDPLRFAAGLVALGEADGCVAGAGTPTADVIRAALWLIGMRSGIAYLSAAMYHGLPDGRVLTYTDIAVNPTPDPAQLAAAAIAAADDRLALVGDEPRVAFLSFSTHGSAEGPEIDRVRNALELFRAARPLVAADGELQLDAALVPSIAAAKCPQSAVAGNANVLVFPSLDAGNIAYKLTERLAGASAAGPLLQGLMKPMSDLSRGAAVDDIVDVGAMVALQAAAKASGTLQPR